LTKKVASSSKKCVGRWNGVCSFICTKGKVWRDGAAETGQQLFDTTWKQNKRFGWL